MNPIFYTLLAQTPPATLETPVTITFVPSALLTSIIVGLIAGFLANVLVRGRAGLMGSLIVGLLGAFVGNILFSLVQFQVSPTLLEGITLRWIDIILSFIGAVIVLLLYYAIFGRRRRLD